MGKRTHEQRARALLVGVLLPGGSLATREWWELVGLCLHPPPSLSCVSYRAPGVTPSPRPGDALLLLLPRERSLLLCRARSVSPACPPLTDIPQSARPPLLCARTQGLPISTSKPLLQGSACAASSAWDVPPSSQPRCLGGSFSRFAWHLACHFLTCHVG